MQTNTLSMTTAAACITAHIHADNPVFLWGPPGIGKSEMIHQIAAQEKMGLIDFRASLRDPVDLRGLPLVDEKTGKSRWLPPHELPDEKRDGERGILFLDELNVAGAAMQAACFGLVLERRLGEYVLPKGWIPIAAGNRMADRAAAQRMPTALRNRFAHFDVGADVEAWCKWATRSNVDPILVAFIRFRNELIHVMPKDDSNSFPTPRSWVRCARMISAPEEIRSNLFASLVGAGPAIEFEAYIQLWKNLPSIAEVLRNPTGARIPADDKPGERYAISTGLARKVTRDTFEAAITYCKRLDPEFRIIMVKDAVERDASLKETEAFVKWSIDNQEVTL